MMKRMIAMLLVVLMVGCLFATTALAGNDEVPDNVTIATAPDAEAEAAVEAEQPVSPQTGRVPAAFLLGAAVLFCGVSDVLYKKAMA